MGIRELWRRRAILASKRSVVVLALLVVAFLALGVLVRYSILQSVDIKVSRELQETSVAPLDQVMIAASFLGSTAFVSIVAVVLALGLGAIKHARAGWMVILSLMSIPVDMGLKQLWARARPDENIVHVLVNRTGFSFPSGHALVGTTFYGCLAILAWIHLKDHHLRKPAVIVLAIMPVVIDTSRVYLGAHWFSDVVGGSAVGLILLLLMTSWYRSDKQEVAKPIDSSAVPTPGGGS